MIKKISGRGKEHILYFGQGIVTVHFHDTRPSSSCCQLYTVYTDIFIDNV